MATENKHISKRVQTVYNAFRGLSKRLIIGVVVCFVATSLSFGTALYLNHQNDRLNNEAYNFWLVKALYPEVSKTIEKKLGEDPKGLNQQAEKEMEKQEAIKATQARQSKQIRNRSRPGINLKK